MTPPVVYLGPSLDGLLTDLIDRGFPGTPLERSIILRAIRFAREKHAAQNRKGSGIPYF